MAYDPVRDEIIVPSFFGFAILTFRGDADGDVPPVRKIFGPKTLLQHPEALAVDPIHGEIFVPQGDKVYVFPRDADGDVAPIRILAGPATQSDFRRLTVDPVHNLLISTGGPPRALRIYDRTASGNTKPRAVIIGPKSMAEGSNLLTNYPPKGLIIATTRGGDRHDALDFVGVWSIHDNGDVPPLWTIGGPNGIFKDIRGVTFDAKNKSIMASDKTLNAILTFHVPEVF